MLQQAQDWTDRSKKVLSKEGQVVSDSSIVSTSLTFFSLKNIPFMLDGADEIRQRIQAVDDLVIRIQQAFPRRNWRKAKLPLIKLNSFLEEVDLLHVDFSEANILRSHIETAEKWAAKASKAIADRAELKVSSIRHKGPVSEPLCDHNEQVLQALLSESETIPVEMTQQIADLEEEVSTASEWVQRARRAVPRQSKTRSAHPDKVDFNAVKELLREAESMQTEVKEVEEMRAIVIAGNEWLQKMEVALAEGEAADVSTLRALLIESEEMPMVMDEQLLLSAEIDARLWAQRAKEALEKKKLPPKNVRELLSEIEVLRGTLPSKYQKQLKVNAETELRDGLASADSWLQRSKRALGGSGVGRRSATKATVERMEQLIAEAHELPADVTDRVNQLQAAIEQAQAWGTKARALLDEIGEWHDDENEGVVKPATDEAADNTTEAGQCKPKKKTTIELLRTMQKEQAKLPADVREAEILRDVMLRVESWVESASACKARGSSSGKGRAKAKLPLGEAKLLVAEAELLPVEVAEEAQRLAGLLKEADEWQVRARAMMEAAKVAYKELGDGDADGVDMTAEQGADDGEQARRKKRKPASGEKRLDVSIELHLIQHKHEEFKEMAYEASRNVAVLTQEERVLQLLVAALEWTRRYDQLFPAEHPDQAEVQRQKLSILQQLVDDGDRIECITLPQLPYATTQLEKCREHAENLRRHRFC
eukprot:g156.t1